MAERRLSLAESAGPRTGPRGGATMQDAPVFDEVHVVSDLHLGGRQGFQIFGSTKELASLILALAATDAQRRVALVINGDFIDFLAEEPGSYFDTERAVAKLDRVVGDTAFAPIFAALRQLAATPGRTLVINLGNHDLELALPWVRAHFLAMLCADEPAARAHRVHRRRHRLRLRSRRRARAVHSWQRGRQLERGRLRIHSPHRPGCAVRQERERVDSECRRRWSST